MPACPYAPDYSGYPKPAAQHIPALTETVSTLIIASHHIGLRRLPRCRRLQSKTFGQVKLDIRFMVGIRAPRERGSLE